MIRKPANIKGENKEMQDLCWKVHDLVHPHALRSYTMHKLRGTPKPNHGPSTSPTPPPDFVRFCAGSSPKIANNRKTYNKELCRLPNYFPLLRLLRMVVRARNPVRRLCFALFYKIVSPLSLLSTPRPCGW